jgi:hypothetical protein
MATKEQLKAELDSLEDTQALDQVFQLIQVLKLSFTKSKTITITDQQEQARAMNDFFGMHKDLGVHSVEEELRIVRRGRRGLFNDI